MKVRIYILVALLLLMPLVKTIAAYNPSYETRNVIKNLKVDYSALGDGTTNESDLLQQAIDDVAAVEGGGVVYIPVGDYLFRKIQLRSNVHIEVENSTKITHSSDVDTHRNSTMFILNSDAADPLVNISIRSVPIFGQELTGYERFTVYLNNDTKAPSAISIRNVENFLIAGVNFQDDYTIHSCINFNPLGTSWETGGYAKNGTVRDCSAYNCHYGYGLIQAQSADTVHFENLYGEGGATLRFETGLRTMNVSGFGGVHNVTAKNIRAKNGKGAVEIYPHSMQNGKVVIEDVFAESCAYAVSMGAGSSHKDESSNLLPGTFAEGTAVKNVVAVFGTNAQLKYHNTLNVPLELQKLITSVSLDGGKSVLGPSIAAVKFGTNYNATISGVKAYGYKYMPPIFTGYGPDRSLIKRKPMGISEDPFSDDAYDINLDGKQWSVHTNIGPNGRNWFSGDGSFGVVDMSVAQASHHAINYVSFAAEKDTSLIVESDFRYFHQPGGDISTNLDEAAIGLVVSDNRDVNNAANTSFLLLGNRGDGIGAVSPLGGSLAHTRLGLDTSIGGWSDWFKVQWFISRGDESSGNMNYVGHFVISDMNGGVLFTSESQDLMIPNGTEIYAGYTTGANSIGGAISSFSHFSQIQVDNFCYEKLSDIEVMAQWGEIGGDSYILEASKGLRKMTSTYTPGRYSNPAYGVEYYDEDVGRSPIFNYTASANSTTQRVADGGGTDADYIETSSESTHHRSLLVWEKFLVDAPFLHSMSAETRVSTLASVKSSSRWIVKEGDEWYASDEFSINSNFTLYELEDLKSVRWYRFDPNQDIKDIVFAGLASFVDLKNVGAVGIFTETEHDGSLIEHQTRFFNASSFRSVTPLTSWESFETEHKLSLGKFGDEDGDGVLNYAEYALAGDPTQLDIKPQTPSVVFAEDGSRQFRAIQLIQDNNFDVRYTVEATNDLVSGVWVELPDLPSTKKRISIEYLEVLYTLPQGGASDSLYLRLKAEID